MSVSIIGTQSSGKTTFLGLLYQTMELRANRDEENFRFYIPPESGDRILEIRNSMLRGNFPPGNTGNKEVTRFLLGFKAERFEKFGDRFAGLVRGGGWDDFLWMVLSAYEVTIDDISKMYFAEKPEQKTGMAPFNTSILLTIIDSSLLTLSTEEKKRRLLNSYDSYLSNLLSGFVAARKKTRNSDKKKSARGWEKSAKRNPLNMIFTFTKVDLLEAKIRKKYDTRGLMESYSSDISRKIGHGLIEEFMPLTNKVICNSVPADRRECFFSHVGWEYEDSQKGRFPKLTVYRPENGSGHVRNQFPEQVYDGLLDHFGNLSKRHFDPRDMVCKMKR